MRVRAPSALPPHLALNARRFRGESKITPRSVSRHSRSVRAAGNQPRRTTAKGNVTGGTGSVADFVSVARPVDDPLHVLAVRLRVR